MSSKDHTATSTTTLLLQDYAEQGGDITPKAADEALQFLSAWRRDFIHADWSANGQSITFKDYNTASIESALRNEDLLPTVKDIHLAAEESVEVSAAAVAQLSHPVCLGATKGLTGGKGSDGVGDGSRTAFDRITDELLNRHSDGDHADGNGARPDYSLSAFQERLQGSIDDATNFTEAIKARRPGQEATIMTAMAKADMLQKSAEAEQRRAAR